MSFFIAGELSEEYGENARIIWIEGEHILMENSEITSSTAALQDSSSIYRQNTEYAAIVVSTLPILCIYPFVQKYFVTGMTIGAVKA